MWVFLLIIAFFFIDVWFSYRARRMGEKEIEKLKKRFPH